MGSTYLKVTTLIMDRKKERRINFSSSSTGRRLQCAKKRWKIVWAARVAKLTAAARGVTRRVTRSMTRQQTHMALASAKTSPRVSSPSKSPSKSVLALTSATNSITPPPIIAPQDSPLYLPREVRTVVPQLDLCGRQNCGQHGDMTTTTVLVTCRDCRTKKTPAAMHCLPCGHVLCHGCLTEAVWTMDAHILDPASWNVIEQALYDHYFESTYSTYSSSHPVKPSFDRALEAAAFTCCGRPMQLDNYLACLDPDTAAAYWLAHETLRWPPDMTRHHCGWPDCGRILAPDCAFERDNMTMYYCVRCRGNSLYVREGCIVPARSSDEEGN